MAEGERQKVEDKSSLDEGGEMEAFGEEDGHWPFKGNTQTLEIRLCCIRAQALVMDCGEPSRRR